MDFKKTIQLIDSATADFEKSVSSSERLIYAETQKIIKSLEIDASGKIKPSVKNLRLLTKMRKHIARLANNKGYLKAVKDLVNSFEEVYQSQMKYFSTITQDVPHTKKYALMKQIAIDNTITNLTGAGLQASVTDKINDMLLRAVTSGAKYADLTNELHEHLTKTDKGSGALSKYANTYATTAISQYAGENNKILTDDLGLEWFEYVGSNIETTREFCEHLTEKRYIHKSEIKTILKGEIDGHQCEIYEKTGLPKGMIEGTNEQNFQVNCGGWNCRHQLVPVAKEAIPKNEKEALPYRKDPDYTDVKTNKQGGMKATHVGHNKHSATKEETFFDEKITSTELEYICQDKLFKLGHKAILCDENKRDEIDQILPSLDLNLDGVLMDIRTITSGKIGSALLEKNKQLSRFYHRTNHKSNSVCLYFHKKELFDKDIFLKDVKWFADKQGVYYNTKILKFIYVVLGWDNKLLKYEI